MLGSKCDLKIHVRNVGYTLPLQIRVTKTTFFRRLCNLTATSAVYIFGTKHDVHNRERALESTRGYLHLCFALRVRLRGEDKCTAASALFKLKQEY